MYVCTIDATKADEWKISFQRAANGWNRCWELMNKAGGGEGGGWGALIRIISRCAACANVENVLPSVKGWWWQQVLLLLLLPAGHTLTNTHSHTRWNAERKQLGVCAKYACLCVGVGVCVGWSALLNMMTSKCQKEEVTEPDSGDEDKVT